MIYVASSWRNGYQPEVVDRLRNCGYLVYDFRNPRPGENGFAWSEIDPEWERWTTQKFAEALEHPIAKRGFTLDMDALIGCEACVLVLPSGRSAHIEAGHAVGAGKPLFIIQPEPCEPELMYAMAVGVYASIAEALVAMDRMFRKPV